MRRAFLFLFLTPLVACVHVEDVPGPNGETAHLIQCRETAACYEKANDLCPGGYTLRSNDTKVNGSFVNGAGGVSSSTEILVSCDADLPSHNAAAAAPPGVDSDRDDVRVCEAAYAYVGDFATYWVARTPGAKRLDELPQKRDFVVTCRAMSEPVQRCMHDKYRQAHAQACEAMLSRLDASPHARVDALFLAAPQATAPAASPPDTKL